jgi:hypothetical protein
VGFDGNCSLRVAILGGKISGAFTRLYGCGPGQSTVLRWRWQDAVHPEVVGSWERGLQAASA